MSEHGMLEHGGRVRAAAQRYGIPESDWLDLSTGINPQGWPVPPFSKDIWRRLPQDDDELNVAAQSYYRTSRLLAVAGSQAAIQALPRLRAPARVAVVAPSYAEHASAWLRNGHQIVAMPSADIVNISDDIDVAVIVNPNNPSGRFFHRDELMSLHQRLAARGGWLVVDEAFMDATPQHSLAEESPRAGLVVLRSVGKFFGLAGARVGFVLGEQKLLDALASALGPWPIAAPSRHVATLALRDSAWQQASRQALAVSAQRLSSLLSKHDLSPAGGCSLFQWVRCSDAVHIHDQLARRGVLTRLFDQPHSVRFGLPHGEVQWERLAAALKEGVI